MRLDLRYGVGSLPIENGTITIVEELAPKQTEGLSDIGTEVYKALHSPINAKPLIKEVTQDSVVAIVLQGEIDNNLSSLILESVFSSLSNAAVDPSQVHVIVSREQISPNQIEAIDESLGSIISRDYNLLVHSPELENSLVEVGYTPTHSTPLYLNSRFVRSNYRIAIGDIRPSIFLGATGGRTGVLPGVSGIRTIARNRKLMATAKVNSFSLNTPACIDMSEAAACAGLNMIVNTVPDWMGNVAAVVSGDPEISWMQGAKVAQTLATCRPKQRADIAVVSAGGSPHDQTLFEAVDSLFPAYIVTKHGAPIVLVAECSGGIGAEGFVKGVSKANSLEEAYTVVQTEYELGMEKSWHFWKMLQNREIILCSRLRQSLVEERLHCTAVRDPQEGLDLAKRKVGTRSKVVVIPDGSRVHISNE
ncbi:MAG: lactate racemase domain-containing protein [Candidatus Hodarchaeota archaeon]